jgi:hypothetical protein
MNRMLRLPPPLPADAQDATAAQALVDLGWELAAPSAPTLLPWLAQGDSPVAGVLRPFFNAAGARLAPHNAPLLEGGDEALKHALLGDVLAQSPPLVDALWEALERLATEPTDAELRAGVTELAQGLLR